MSIPPITRKTTSPPIPSGSRSHDWLSDNDPFTLSRANRDAPETPQQRFFRYTNKEISIGCFGKEVEAARKNLIPFLPTQRSTTGTLNFLITHYEWFWNNSTEALMCISSSKWAQLSLRFLMNTRRRIRGISKWWRHRWKEKARSNRLALTRSFEQVYPFFVPFISLTAHHWWSCIARRSLREVKYISGQKKLLQTL